MSDNNIEPIAFKAPTLAELDGLLSGYKFESFIAKGGMGAVYLATQTSLDRPVAVKVLPRELGDDEAFRKSFQAEAKHMAKLNHPNLIGIYDFGDIDGMLYIIMEYVKGKSLYEASYGKAIVEKKAAQIIIDVSLGLHHAHEAGILHRDVKPANIILGKGSTPKIGDFGLARPQGNTEAGVIYGTPGYSAPEVLNAPDDVNQSTDVFAVGVMFYQLLTGKMPDPDRYQPPSELVDIDPKFDDIIKKSMNPRRRMRYESAGELAEVIEDVLKGTQEPQKKVNPLLRASSGEGNDSGAKIATPLAQTAHAAQTASPIPAQAVAPVAPSSPMARNILIILVLLGALFAALQFKDWREKDIKTKEAKNHAEHAAIKEKKERLKQERAEEMRLAAEERKKEREGKKKKQIQIDPNDTPIVK